MRCNRKKGGSCGPAHEDAAEPNVLKLMAMLRFSFSNFSKPQETLAHVLSVAK